MIPDFWVMPFGPLHVANTYVYVFCSFGRHMKTEAIPKERFPCLIACVHALCGAHARTLCPLSRMRLDPKLGVRMHTCWL